MRRVVNVYFTVLVGVMTALVMALTVIVSYQVFSRYVGFIPPYLWTEEASRFCFIWLVLLGSAIAVREGTHFTIDVLPEEMPAWLQRTVEVMVLSLIALIALVMFFGGLRFAEIGWTRISTTSGIRLAWVYAAIPVSGFSILLFVAEQLVDVFRGERARLGSREGLESEEIERSGEGGQ